MAEYTSMHELTDTQKEDINKQLITLQQEVNELDEKSQNFWLEHQ